MCSSCHKAHVVDRLMRLSMELIPVRTYVSSIILGRKTGKNDLRLGEEKAGYKQIYSLRYLPPFIVAVSFSLVISTLLIAYTQAIQHKSPLIGSKFNLPHFEFGICHYWPLSPLSFLIVRNSCGWLYITTQVSAGYICLKPRRWNHFLDLCRWYDSFLPQTDHREPALRLVQETLCLLREREDWQVQFFHFFSAYLIFWHISAA